MTNYEKERLLKLAREAHEKLDKLGIPRIVDGIPLTLAERYRLIHD